MRSSLFAGASLVMSTLLLGGCGGGGGGGASAVPIGAIASGTQAISTQTSTVSITLALPATTAASATLRSIKYVSVSTKSMAIAVNGGAPSVANCTTSCTANVSAPVGSDTFVVVLYDQQNGTGNPLSSGSTASTIVAGKTNTLSLVVGGVVASVALSLQTNSVAVGTAASIPVAVVPKDADGNVIIGSDPFTTPITLSDSDASGATKLSTTNVATPNTAVTLAYTGATFASATISPSVAGLATNALTPAQLSAIAAPVANVPSHVQTLLYYGLDGVNTSLPATFMAAHADFTESDTGESPTSSTNFKAAGGKWTLAYTDPGYVPYCAPPFTAPAGACRGAVGSENPPEDAWFHGADGARINEYVSPSFLYEEALNPASVDTQNAYHAYTQTVASLGTMDYMMADDSGNALGGGNFYGFNEPETDVTTDAAFLAGRQALFAASTRPVIYNGSGPDGMPAYNGAYLKSPNVMGQMHENCFVDDTSGPVNDGVWETTANSLLENTSFDKLAICLTSATPTVASRTYLLASWWMVYDPTYSVVAPVGKTSDGYAVFPELDIVPTQPLHTATTAVSALRTGGGSGAFVREFAACYQASKPIGHCAAIVNTSTATLTIPSLTQSYTHSLALSGNSTYTNGSATWSGAMPASVPAQGAVIVLQ